MSHSDDETRIVHELKRMRLDGTKRARTASIPIGDHRSGRSSPSVLVPDDDTPYDEVGSKFEQKRRLEQIKRSRLMDLLQDQLRLFKSQYASISQEPNIAPCDFQ